MSEIDDETHVNTSKMQFSRRLKRALRRSDFLEAYFNLKKLNVDKTYQLDNATMEKLHELIRKFKTSKILLIDDFDGLLFKLLKNIKSESIELHIASLSLLPHNEIEYFREIFSYTKIYSIFKLKIGDLFSEKVDVDNLSYLIKLLNNEKLVYKSLLPVFKKISKFVDEKFADSSILECCGVLNSVADCCESILTDSFIASIVAFFMKVLYEPQSFLFIDFRGSKIIINSVKSLLKRLDSIENKTVDLKKLSLGLLRECISRIEGYKSSTVYEECMVVVSLTELITPIFEIYAKHDKNFNFIDKNFLKFLLFDKKLKNESKESKKLKTNGDNAIKIDFGRPFKNHYNFQYQKLRDDFIVSKYKFIDCFYKHRKEFNRVLFYNDLSFIENPNELFSILNNLKPVIDWSDLIVFACNAPQKELYIPFLFDKYFIDNSNHVIFLEIFLKNNKDDEFLVLLYTHFSIKSNFTKSLAQLYLIDLEKDDLINKKKRRLIIEYIDKIAASFDKTPESFDKTIRKTKEVDINEGGDGLNNEPLSEGKVIENCQKTESIPFNIDFLSDFNVEKYPTEIEIQEFLISLTENLEDLHYNLAPLLVLLSTKKLQNDKLTDLLIKIKNKIRQKGDEFFICFIGVMSILYKNDFLSKQEITTLSDVLAITLTLKGRKWSKESIIHFKEKSFDTLLCLSFEDLKKVKTLFTFADKSDPIICELYKLIWYITGKRLFEPNKNN